MSLKLFFCYSLSFHPGMVENFDQWSSKRCSLYGGVDDIFELIGQCWNYLLILFPEIFIGSLVTRNREVVTISAISILPRIGKTFCNKKHRAKCENIDILTLVCLCFFYFWSHIHSSTLSGNCKTTSTSSTQILCKAKVDDFKFKLLCHHYVL